MLEFLNAVLSHVGEEPIIEIISMKSEYSIFGESADQKYGRLDVRVKAESGRLFDIEVQIEKDYVNERGFFYGGRLGNEEFEIGTSYDKMPEVRVINLVDFYLREDHSKVVEPVVLSYANNPSEVATTKFKMYHIQLPAFRKEYKTLKSVEGDPLFTWLYMLDQGYKNEKEMEELSVITEGLRNFANQYNYAINDPDLIRRYRMIEDGKRDIATRISVAEKKAEERGEKRGKKQGEKRGEMNARLQSARVMKADGMSSELIAKYSGLSLDEIAEL